MDRHRIHPVHDPRDRGAHVCPSSPSGGLHPGAAARPIRPTRRPRGRQHADIHCEEGPVPRRTRPPQSMPTTLLRAPPGSRIAQALVLAIWGAHGSRDYATGAESRDATRESTPPRSLRTASARHHRRRSPERSTPPALRCAGAWAFTRARRQGCRGCRPEREPGAPTSTKNEKRAPEGALRRSQKHQLTAHPRGRRRSRAGPHCGCRTRCARWTVPGERNLPCRWSYAPGCTRR